MSNKTIVVGLAPGFGQKKPILARFQLDFRKHLALVLYCCCWGGVEGEHIFFDHFVRIWPRVDHTPTAFYRSWPKVPGTRVKLGELRPWRPADLGATLPGITPAGPHPGQTC